MSKIWLVEHPCDAGVKAKAAKDGCKVIDLRFKDSFKKEDIKKIILKDKPKKAATVKIDVVAVDADAK